MKINVLLLLSAIPSYRFADATIVSHSPYSKGYTQFQSLGLSILTGPASIIGGFNGTCQESLGGVGIRERDCPGGIAIPPSYLDQESGTFCLSCATINPECGCSIESADTLPACAQSTGLLAWAQPSCYLGKANLTQDVLGRLAIMEAAVETAYNHSDKNENVLKIFNAPEFFFRGPTGAYNIEGVYEESGSFPSLEVIAVFLEELTSQERFKDWLFQFGTVIAYHETEDPNGTTVLEFLNFAPIYRGHDPQTTDDLGKRLIVPKRYVSGIDFLKPTDRFNTSFIIPDPQLTSSYYDNAAWKQLEAGLEDFGFTLIRNNWFYMDDIAFSAEICLDHAQAVAYQNYEFIEQSNGTIKVPSFGDNVVYQRDLDSLAQISLVTSAGMDITPNSLVISSGGSVFLQDGLNAADSQLGSCYLKPAANGEIDYDERCGPVESMVSNSVVYNASEYFVYGTKEEAEAAMKDLFTMYGFTGPKIRVYDPVDIATYGKAATTEPPTVAPTLTPAVRGGDPTSGPTSSASTTLLSTICSIVSILFVAWVW